MVSIMSSDRQEKKKLKDKLNLSGKSVRRLLKKERRKNREKG